MKLIDIPTEVTACARQLGAVVADDQIGPQKPRNADYWFPDAGVVAELKCLNQNYFDDLSFTDWLATLYKDWVNRRLARPLQATSIINLADLPKECTDDVTSLIRKRLESSFKDANQQIKSTRSEVGAPDARGLLILVNDGNYGLHPGLVQNAVSRLLHKYSGINSVIHFTANMPSIHEAIDRDVLFWCAWSAKSIKPPVATDFLRLFQRTWASHHQSVVGEIIPSFSADTDALYSLKFIGR